MLDQVLVDFQPLNVTFDKVDELLWHQMLGWLVIGRTVQPSREERERSSDREVEKIGEGRKGEKKGRRERDMGKERREIVILRNLH